jgi:hypothetical protein
MSKLVVGKQRSGRYTWERTQEERQIAQAIQTESRTRDGVFAIPKNAGSLEAMLKGVLGPCARPRSNR